MFFFSFLAERVVLWRPRSLDRFSKAGLFNFLSVFLMSDSDSDLSLLSFKPCDIKRTFFGWKLLILELFDSVILSAETAVQQSRYRFTEWTLSPVWTGSSVWTWRCHWASALLSVCCCCEKGRMNNRFFYSSCLPANTDRDKEPTPEGLTSCLSFSVGSCFTLLTVVSLSAVHAGVSVLVLHAGDELLRLAALQYHLWRQEEGTVWNFTVKNSNV